MRNYLRLLLSSLVVFLSPGLNAMTGRFFPHGLMSSSLVTNVCQDKYGYIWVGTEYGLNKFDGYQFTSYFHKEGDDSSLPGNSVTQFAVGRDSTLWIGLVNGLARYDYASNSFVTYRFPDGRKPRVSSLTFDRSGLLLVGTAGRGIYKLSGGRLVLDTRFFREGMSSFYDLMVIDKNGALWCVGNEKGIARIKPNVKGMPKREIFPSPMGQPLALLDTKAGIVAIYKDGIERFDASAYSFTDAGYDLSALGKGCYIENTKCHDGEIYVKSSSGRVGVFKRNSEKVVPLTISMKDIDLHNTGINDFCRDRDGNLWLTLYGRGLLLLTPSTTAFHVLNFISMGMPPSNTMLSIAPYQGGMLCVLPPMGVYNIGADGKLKGHMPVPKSAYVIYLDSKGRYWLCDGGEAYSYNPSTGQLKKVFSVSGTINHMADFGDKLYVSSMGLGFFSYDDRTQQLVHYTMRDKKRKGGTLNNDWIYSMCADRQGRLWLCTSDGCSCLDTSTGKFTHNGWSALLSGLACNAVAFTPKGNAIIGTSMGLWLFDWSKNKVMRFPGSSMLNDESVSAIVKDRSGDLWISTMNGLWQWNHRSKTFIGHISGNGLSSKEYWANIFFHDSTDRIGFGNPDGITVFRPDDVRHSRHYYGKIYLTKVMIGGKEVGAMSDSYHVGNDEKTLTLEFSLLNYRYADNVIYQYQLNGGQWTNTDGYSNVLTFNHMNYGNYTLEVRATSNGLILAPVKRITVSVDPPWYLTKGAFAVYVLAFIIIVGVLLLVYVRRKRYELEDAKMRFLINATHDIRSPLTLIMEPLRKLRKNVTDPESRREIETIEWNAGRLQTLVNQILDKRRIDKKQMQLHCRKTDLVQFTASIISLYRYNADERHIAINFTHADRAEVWIDRNNFDKVVANLLSNAFKYTPDGGCIDIDIAVGEDKVSLTVSDSGPGFDSGSLKHVFDRFYQGSNSRDMHVGGTGIGLNLCQAITKLHGGTIKAANRSGGHSGAQITVTLLKGNKHLKPEQIEKGNVKEVETKRKQANRNIHLMVVDDDQELAAYIKEELADWYRTDIFPNGKEALNALLKGNYDVVVSDVVMPEMNGIELLKAIKGNSRISVVPVILLTSKVEVADELEGIKHGADAYIAKPFSIDVLHATIDNVVDNVRRLRGVFSGVQDGAGMSEDVEVKGYDDALMERIMGSINKHIADPDFNVEQLCDEVGISRSQLHRKMKEMTGVATSDFIRNLRLNQAAKLISEGKVNISQVAFSVGFNSTTHFSTVFKKHFGVSPSEYAAKKGN